MSATHSLDLEASSSQYASIADVSSPNLEILGSQTYEAWIKPESFTNYQYIMGKVNAGATLFKHLWYNNSGTIFCSMYGLTTNDSVSASGLLSIGIWTHVAAVYNSSNNTLKLYINGEEVSSVTASGSTSDIGSAFAIGRGGDYNGNYCDGTVRNVRIWNVARTQAQIRADMNVDIPSNSTGLQGNWILNNNYEDSSANGYDLTASGSPVFTTTYPDSIDLAENGGWNGKHKIVIDNTKVSGSADFSNFPVVLTEDNFLDEIFTHSQGAEINENALINSADLLSYYRMEGDSTDTQGNINGTDTGITYNFSYGKFGQGANFSGTGSQIVMTGRTMPAEHTFSAWFKIASWGSYTGVPIFDTIIQIYPGGNKKVNMWMGSANREGGPTIQLNKWYHVAYTLLGTTQKLYVNGELVYTEASSTVSWSSNPELGARQDVGDDTYRLNGNLDDVAFFDTALTESQILQMYKGGADIRFSTDSDGKNRLAHEIVNWDNVNYECEVWVKINNLSHNTDTQIYVHYNNTDVTSLNESEAFGKHQVWPPTYKGVWHLENASFDATLNNRNGTDTAIIYNDGKIKEGVDANGSTSLATLGDTGLPGGSNARTFMGWINIDNAQTFAGIFGYGTATNDNGSLFALDTNGTKLQFGKYGANASEGNTTLSLDTWYHVVFVVSGTSVQYYLNGVDDGNPTLSGINTTVGGFGILGRSYTGGQSFDGLLDEFHLLNTALAIDYVKTVYNNQNNPATFATPISNFIPKVIFI